MMFCASKNSSVLSKIRAHTCNKIEIFLYTFALVAQFFLTLRTIVHVYTVRVKDY